jgi:hypothetical protein
MRPARGWYPLSGYQLENDILIHLNIIGARLTDVPIPARYGDEASGTRLRHVIPAILALLFIGSGGAVFWKYVLWSFSPIAFVPVRRLLLCSWGIGFGVWVVVHTLGPPVASTRMVLLAVATLLVGT